MNLSIDVVIPSFRLDEKYILPMLRLRKPANVNIKFYLVADNPSLIPSPAIQSLVDHKNVFLSVNPENLGSGLTRNNGMNAGNGDWILFLDDDVMVPDDLLETYAQAAVQHADEIGFIGLVNLPKPTTAFTKALTVSGSLDIFSIAGKKASFAWGATANMMIKRSAAGNIQFTGKIPKTGGGEEVDFFLKIRERNQYRNYKTLPQAAVQHPWWNNEQPNYRKPFFYGIGNSWLGDLNPQYAYYDFPNTPETLLLSLVAMIITGLLKPMWVGPLLVFMAGVILIEIIASLIQTIKRSGTGNVQILMYVITLRIVYETGLLWGKLSRLRFGKIGERFHDNGTINKVYFYRTNTYKIVKWVLYPLLVIYILRYFV